MNNFFYEDPAGEGITVYHIDIGQIAMDHDEFKTDYKARRETIEVNLDKENRVEDADHGTCAASKIVGQGVSTAKCAGLVTVRIDADAWGVIEGLQAAAKDIMAKDLRGKAVVSISVGVETEDATIIEYIRVGSVAADVRDLIGATSFPRITHEAGYPSMAWNLWGSQQACSVNGGGSSGAQSRVMRRALEGRQLPACSLAPSWAPATAAPTAARGTFWNSQRRHPDDRRSGHHYGNFSCRNSHRASQLWCLRSASPGWCERGDWRAGWLPRGNSVRTQFL